MNLYSRSLLLLAVAIVQIYGEIYDQVSQLPTDVYDYIVVGGTFPTIQPAKGTNSSVIVIRRGRWQCDCEPFDRRQQRPSARPRGWWKVSRASVIHHIPR